MSKLKPGSLVTSSDSKESLEKKLNMIFNHRNGQSVTLKNDGTVYIGDKISSDYWWRQTRGGCDLIFYD